MGISNASRGLCQLTHGLRENASQFLEIGNWLWLGLRFPSQYSIGNRLAVP